jgi:hypothetical protein
VPIGVHPTRAAESAPSPARSAGESLDGDRNQSDGASCSAIASRGLISFKAAPGQRHGLEARLRRFASPSSSEVSTESLRISEALVARLVAKAYMESVRAIPAASVSKARS